MQPHKIAALTAALLALTACGNDSSAPAAPPAPSAEPQAMAPQIPAEPAPAPTPAIADSAERLSQALAAQPAEVQARYAYRHPFETLTFFGIEPGMTVVEALPGGGWYSKILLPYLGSEGKLIGADHPLEMQRISGYYNEEQLKAKETWAQDWPKTAAEWRSEGDAQLDAFMFAALPESMHGTADAVLLVRALHGPAGLESQGGFLTQIFQDSFAVLKSGGTLGIVQHEAREDMPDDWAAGPAGYMKKSAVIAAATAAGFELAGDSPINENPADQPTVDDRVWRLPPNLRVVDNDAEQIERNRAIGESNRMTVKFRKP